jgi:hypothetical protein
MKIVHIVPGSGGTFYCENCLRDSSLVRAVRAIGHDVMMAPMYLPVFTDEPELTRDTPVFFGGINVYLKERIPFFRRVPRWLDGFLDSRWLLRLAARRAGSTRARDLGPMTLAMIRSDSAYHQEETDRMLDWLLRDEKPDVVHIGTVMLIGLSRWIRERTDAPISRMRMSGLTPWTRRTATGAGRPSANTSRGSTGSSPSATGTAPKC